MAQGAEEAKDTAEDGAAPAGGGKSKLIPLLLVVNTGLVAGVLVFTLTRKPAPPPAAAATPDEHKAAEHGEAKPEEHGGGGEAKGPAAGAIGPTVRLENFVVQLRAVDAERYAHITLELELAAEPDKDKVAAMLPRIRDTVIAYLADRTADELRGSEGLAKLKDAVLERLQTIVPGRKVTNVYITDFIVQ